MTPDAAARRAQLESVLERIRANRARLGHPGLAPEPVVDEPATSRLFPVVPAAPAAAAPPSGAARPAAFPLRMSATPVAPLPTSGVSRIAVPIEAPPIPPAAAPLPAPEPEPAVEAPMTWEGEDEEEMVMEDAAPVEAAVPAVAEEEPLAAPPRRPSFEPLAETTPLPPPPLPTTTVAPSAAAVPAPTPAPQPAPAVAAPAAASTPAPPEAEPVPVRIVAPPPAEAPVVFAEGSVEPVRPRTIGGLLGAALRLFEKS